MPDVAYAALFLALAVSVYAGVVYVIGARSGNAERIASARNAVFAVFILMTVAEAIMIAALFGRDFRIEYVANYTDRSLSFFYTLSAIWAGNRGSLLFWAWVLSGCSALMVFQKREVARDMVPYAAAVAMFTQVFFLLLLVSVSNPFARLPFTPADGAGLNPLLENPGMFIHPPTQLIGYIGFTVPFAFAVAALITGNLGDDWIRASRRWTLISWTILGIGNMAGSWWAYYVLGWGGYWAWDPVENAGLLPWLVSTAFLHSAMMQRRRGILKQWNMVLIILTFVLSIFGTFLTRSGVLGSVHSFAESALGPFFVAFMAVSLVIPLVLLIYRGTSLKGEAEIESAISRESTFLLNNLLLVSATFAVFLGTVFPLISEAVTGAKITVGPPFFNQVLTPIFLGIIFLTGICTMIGWRRASVKNLVRNFIVPVAATLLLVAVLFVSGVQAWYALLAVGLCVFVLFSITYEWLRGARARHRTQGENYIKAFFSLLMANRPRYGGYIVHVGIMVMALGMIGMSFADGKEVTLRTGESVNLNSYTLTYRALDRIETQSKVLFTTTLAVQNQGKPIGLIIPEKYFHRVHTQPVTVAAVRSTLLEDLYVILINWEEDGASASFKIMANPLVNWMWIGMAVLVLGALVAFWPERQKLPRPPREAGEKK
ncbi:MAG: heme lyase CcmF/NrfE family subunit [Chloroflexi bacterium]|nr:heme lyase CcmF/NrfE family subunit [Chloroflexota bacterium]